jgi:hypothetical protein
MAHLSNDAGLITAFRTGQVFSVAPDQVTNDLRRSAKAINFDLNLWNVRVWSWVYHAIRYRTTLTYTLPVIPM